MSTSWKHYLACYYLIMLTSEMKLIAEEQQHHELKIREGSLQDDTRTENFALKAWQNKGGTWDKNTIAGQYDTRDNSRGGKFLKVWTVVQFANNPCRGTNDLNGTCVSAAECTNSRGTASGSCASGYGVCCVYQVSCGASVRVNVTYFVNPDYPNVSNVARSCVLQVNKLSNNVEQLRLDLELFRLNGVTDGNCATDVFAVAGQDPDEPVPPTCGINDGQHFYVNVRNVPGPITLSATTSGMGSRQWRIKVTQLERGNTLLAPNDCLQYFIGPTGLLKSFNFDSPTPPNGQSNYNNNLNYALCIRREAGSCMVRYIASDETNSFDLEIPESMSGLDGTCSGDYLFIPGSQNTPPNSPGIGSRFCGVALSATPASITSIPLINSLAGPIELAFVTNANAPSGAGDRGFSIRYQQIPCSSSGRK